VAEEDAQRGDRWSLKISAVPGITKIRRVAAEHERRLDQLLRKAACTSNRRDAALTGCKQTSHPAATLFGVQHFIGSYARSTPVRPVSDLDIPMVMPMGEGKTEAALALVEILATKLNRYYDKTTGTLVDGVPDAPRRPDTVKIAVQALKIRNLGSLVQGRRSVKLTFPQDFGAVDVLPALSIEGAGTVPVFIPTLQLWNAPLAILPSQVPPSEPPDPAEVEREQLRQERDLERRARILLRRMFRVRIRRVRTATVAPVDGVDHSAESHRSRAPGRKTWSSPVFRAPAAA